MLKFSQYLQEMASSIGNDALGHLSHVGDGHVEDPHQTEKFIDLLSMAHRTRMGEKIPGFGLSYKHDGGQAVEAGVDEKGPYVTDKHRSSRKTGAVIARTSEEVQQHFGHHAGMADAMNQLLSHTHKFVKPGRRIRGDLLFVGNDTSSERKGGTVKYTPNRITYEAKTPAKIGIAAHSEINDGVAEGIRPGSVRPHRDVFMPQTEYQQHPSTYTERDRRETEHHLAQARAIIQHPEYSTHHLTDSHTEGSHLPRYLNVQMGEGNMKPTVKGYVQHLNTVAEKEMGKRSSEKGRTAVRQKYDSLIKNVYDNHEHFQRSFDLRHHLTRANESMLRGVQHPDLKTYIDGKPSPGEGLVAHVTDAKGRKKIPVKYVPWSTRVALRNNPKFRTMSIAEQIRVRKNVLYHGNPDFGTPKKFMVAPKRTSGAPDEE